MGEEIQHGHFQKRDFSAFRSCLETETALLSDWFRDGSLSGLTAIGGFELEAWLIDSSGKPAPRNTDFLGALKSPLVVPELSRFNFELNTDPRRLQGDVLTLMQRDLENTWRLCQTAARALGMDVVMIGILPTVNEQDLSLDNMSDRIRFRALNEQVLRLRSGAPIELNIAGPEALHTRHSDVMMESAATSFQIHLQVTPEQAVRFFNASVILSAPMVAACSNSPFLFGHRLWEETRIPLFEQAVSVCAPDAEECAARRVTFGEDYLKESVLECYLENLARFEVLLPEHIEGPVERLSHLRLHNGTIWRWNRPLIGFDPDGTPHLRIEHRVVPAGPSLPDTIANAAFYFGLVHELGEQVPDASQRLSFDLARKNFYTAARHGLEADLTWFEGRAISARDLLVNELLPAARAGLKQLGVDPADRDRYLGIIERRLASGITGSRWQTGWVDRHGPDYQGLTRAYLRQQQSGQPVHEWSLEC